MAPLSPQSVLAEEVGGVRPGHLPAAWPVPTRVLQPSPPSLTSVRLALLGLLSAHRTARGSHLLRGRERPTGLQADVGHSQAWLSPPCPLPRRPPVAAVVARHSGRTHWSPDRGPSAGIVRGAGRRKGWRSPIQPSPARSIGLELCYSVFSFDV